jgi:Uma2 family endonuclease
MTSPHLSRISRWCQAVHETTRIIRHVPLVVEIADSSLAFDRTHKGSLYARARLSEYWIVNLADRMLEVYRDPRPDNGALYGWAYGVMLTLGPDEHIVPLVVPSTRILIADLLP